ncbi:MAG: hypothetical protein RR101_14140 [Burkholderiaceae bacterium]
MTDNTFTSPGLNTDRFGDDADLADLNTTTLDSDLAVIAAEFADDDKPDVATIPLDHRPGYSVVFSLDFTGRDLDTLRKRSKDKRFVDNMDGIKFAALLLGLTCVDILRNGQPLGDALGVDGPVTFATPEVQDLTGTRGSVDATVRKMLKRESGVETVSRRLMTEAGWGDEAYAQDPTD